MIGPNVERYDMLAREYPEVAARIGSVRVGELPTATRRGEPNEWARSYIGDEETPGAIVLNRNFFGRPGRMAREDARNAARGWHPSGTAALDATMTHEFGHHVMFWLRDNEYDPIGFVQHLDGREELSDYASRKLEEAWSEAFRAHYTRRRDIQRSSCDPRHHGVY